LYLDFLVIKDLTFRFYIDNVFLLSVFLDVYFACIGYSFKVLIRFIYVTMLYLNGGGH